MLMLTGALAFSQTHTVSGTVKDEGGASVPYATITENGTKNATTADANGNFSIKMKGTGICLRHCYRISGFTLGDPLR